MTTTPGLGALSLACVRTAGSSANRAWPHDTYGHSKRLFAAPWNGSLCYHTGPAAADTLAGHQVTLLDLLRLLRQRRRTDPAAQTFVTEKLKTAASNVMQVRGPYPCPCAK